MNDYMYISDLQGRKCIFFTRPYSNIFEVYIHNSTPEVMVIDRVKGTAEVSSYENAVLKWEFENKKVKPGVTWTLVDNVIDFLVEYLYTGKEIKFRLPDGIVMKNYMYQSNDTITFEFVPPVPIDVISIDFSYGSKYLGNKDIPKPSSGGSDES